MSKQSNDNHLNKKDLFFLFFLVVVEQITEVFQVKGTVFSFRDHVNSRQHNFKSSTDVVGTNCFLNLNRDRNMLPVLQPFFFKLKIIYFMMADCLLLLVQL